MRLIISTYDMINIYASAYIYIYIYNKLYKVIHKKEMDGIDLASAEIAKYGRKIDELISTCINENV
jgi:hypothetical protein